MNLKNLAFSKRPAHSKMPAGWDAITGASETTYGGWAAASYSGIP